MCILRGTCQLQQIFAIIPTDELRTTGYVLEANLRDIKTLSVGQAIVGKNVISYLGVQNFGNRTDRYSTYTGSDLLIARGGYEKLLSLPMSERLGLAIQQAKKFDEATSNLKIIASRRNYDIGQGYDNQGNFISGVLEQSWRIGGATGAEIIALKYFKDHPDKEVVRASSHVDFMGELPPEARVYGSSTNEKGIIYVYAVIQKIDNY